MATELRMDSVNRYQIRELTIDNQCWRVDWIGSVTYARRYHRPSQPLFEIQFSLVDNADCDEHSLFYLKREECPKTRNLQLPVGLWPMFKIGDFWQNGICVRSPDYDLATFDCLEIGLTQSPVIKAGLPHDEEGNFYLPIGAHPYHACYTQSHCIHVRATECHIIIPSSELIRFYFGSSSNLISRLFDAPLTPQKLWTEIEESDFNGTPKIHLAPGISGRSASDIGRIALSTEARNAAELIGNSCLAATANGATAYPKAIFPFSGRTDLKVSGKWLPLKTNKQGVFLVFKILSCSHPFPFASLRYTCDRSGSSSNRKQAGQGHKEPQIAPQLRFSKNSSVTPLIVDDEPHPKKKPSRLQLFVEGVQFPDLIRKPVSKIEPDEVPTILATAEGVSLFHGVAPGGMGHNPFIKPLDLINVSQSGIESELRDSLPRFVTILLHVTKKLKEELLFSSMEIVRLNPRQRSDYIASMPQIVNEDGEVLPICLVANPDPTDAQKQLTKRRRMSAACAVRRGEKIFFIVPEPKDVDDYLELHLISDRIEAIRDTSEVLAAIATHLLAPPMSEKVVQLRPGVTSTVLNVRFATLPIAEVVETILRQAVGFIEEPDPRVSKDHVKPVCPEYLR